MTSQKDLRLAYEAGQSLWRADNASLPTEAVDDPVAACPFPEGDPQRLEWLKGYQDAIENGQRSTATVTKALNDAIEVADRAS